MNTMNKPKQVELSNIALRLRQNVAKMIGPEQKGHLGGSCSSADIVAALYFHIMRTNAENPLWPDRDRFILSKGHAALIQYAALAELGFFDPAELLRLKTLGSILQGHPETRVPGVEANTGSLGQGVSIACGIAAGLKIDNSDSRVFCIMGDGEQAEGQVWEAAMSASNFNLDNLYAFIDRNRIQATGFTQDRYPTEPLNEKWEAFGWHVQEIDGHDTDQIINAVEAGAAIKNKPKMIIANTIKGKGISFAENVVAFHNGTMTTEQYQTAMRELSSCK